ncbi:hypothetical protein WICMUC_002513 [Wickerhamomyces mucosus]|uniref:Uncharacterized protein n=1 Tax=Wickerhamomyces mucosus TaxID=1378264 RepID=A0A9P8TEA8_9ASCO|nr:hypothetical protein WICMUC_002513 [Wickerhamomyces mucosus]
MLFRQIISKSLRQQSVRSIRFNQFQQIRLNSTVSKIQDASSNLIEKVSNLVNNSIYWSKVVGELSKQVYLKEKLSPPSIAEIREVYYNIYDQFLRLTYRPNEVISFIKNFGKNEFITYGSYAVQIFGLFSLGEIIGRRQIVGYPNFTVHEEH